MPRPMLYGSRLRGYTPYAHGLRSGPAEWIILQMTHNWKFTNRLSYLEHWINFYIIYYPLYMLIMQVYHDFSRMCDFGHMPDSGHPSRLLSTSQLRTHLLTLFTHHDSSQWARRLSYRLSGKRLHMVGLDDCNIFQPGHLVRNRLGGMHDLINVQNLRSHNFACGSSQAMCRTTKEHLACRSLRQTRVSGWTRYPKTLED
jgi:hypothetical protein